MDPMRQADHVGREVAACLVDVHRRPAICVSLEGFAFDQRRRYRRGRPSPEGYIDDSFDYASLKRVVLDPLRPGGTTRLRRAVFDFRTDAPVAGPRCQPQSRLLNTV